MMISDIPIWQFILLPLVSFAVGILGGFIGLALGTIRLPVLLFLGFDAITAAGSNIAVSTLTAAAGSIKHLRNGRVDNSVLITVGIPSMSAAFVAGFFSNIVPEPLIFTVAGALVFWQGIELLTRANDPLVDKSTTDSAAPEFKTGAKHIFQSKHLAPASLGLTIGALGGTIGLILGSLRLPVLIRVMQMPPRTAIGTNMTIGFAMGTLGWIGHVSGGHVNYTVIFLMGPTAVIGSYIGAALTGHVSLKHLIITLGLVLLVVGPLLVFRGVV